MSEPIREKSRDDSSAKSEQISHDQPSCSSSSHIAISTDDTKEAVPPTAAISELTGAMESMSIPEPMTESKKDVSEGTAPRPPKKLLTELTIPRPASMVTKQGIIGDKIYLQSNYFKLCTTTDWCLYQYHVDFAPEEDRTPVRKGLIKLHKDVFGGYIFDGSKLYSSDRLDDKMELFSIRQSDNVKIRITLRLVGDIVKGDHHYLQFFNILMRRCLEQLNLQLVNRNYFDPYHKISMEQHRLELWPGYVTSIRQHEHSILMCTELVHKVMRRETLLDILNQCGRGSTFERTYCNRVVGLVVLTDYNNRTYRIDDVDFTSGPNSRFKPKNGDEISYVDYYYRRYNLRIKNFSQPLLLTKIKSSRQATSDENICLIPELCRATGLNDKMRENFQLMKALSTHTRLSPAARIEKLLLFNEKLSQDVNISKHLFSWNMKLEENLVQFPARILPAEKILFEGTSIQARNGDWGREMQRKKCLVNKSLRNWIVICLDYAQLKTQRFINTIIDVSRGIQFHMEQPRLIAIKDDRSNTYSEILESILSQNNPELVFCVVSNNRSDRYTAIKKKCCVDRPVASQVYLQKNLDHRSVLSIATKVAIQMNCKLGGAPWTVDIPIEGLMVIGFDVCHDPGAAGTDFGAMVASLDQNTSRYFSIANLHGNGEELSNEIGVNVCKALQMYKAANDGKLPARIVFYRDGVGEGQIPYVYKHEVLNIERRLRHHYGGDSYKMAFIIVNKRINSRFFLNRANPPPGTIIDDYITNPMKYDFFIVSQQVRQGTITPTMYTIIYDNIALNADKLQRLTYKLTHMYYNCACTVRVPAPCHYAHKLSYLVAKFIHHAPSPELENTLYFL